MKFNLDKFATIKLEDLISQIATDIESNFECKDIIWLVPDEFRVRQSHSVIRLYTPGNFLKKTNLVNCKGDYPQKELSHLISKFENTTLENEAIDVYFEEKTNSALFKIKGDLKEDIGYFIITEANSEQMIKYKNDLIDYFLQVKSLFKYAFQLDYYEKLTYMDNITDLYNQRYLNAVLQEEFDFAKKNENPFSVLFIDVDYFKMVNDSSGHIVGSKVLIELSKLIKKRLRSSDYAFRYGGDEFVVLLTNSDSQSSFVYAENLRKMVEEQEFNIDGVLISLTISIGLASYPEHASSAEQILKIADESMYYGKNKSRNIVYIAS